QRFNALRKEMRLRAILWEFDEARKLILASWYACETEDWQFKEMKKKSQFYCQDLQKLSFGGGGPHKLPEAPEFLRSFALVRENLLNPNARTLRLGFWTGGSQIDYFLLYAIPQLPYRSDIPTPTQRFRGETVTKDWIDIEEATDIDGKKIPYVTYPFSSEPDAPTVYSN